MNCVVRLETIYYTTRYNGNIPFESIKYSKLQGFPLFLMNDNLDLLVESENKMDITIYIKYALLSDEIKQNILEDVKKNIPTFKIEQQ